MKTSLSELNLKLTILLIKPIKSGILMVDFISSNVKSHEEKESLNDL